MTAVASFLGGGGLVAFFRWLQSRTRAATLKAQLQLEAAELELDRDKAHDATQAALRDELRGLIGELRTQVERQDNELLRLEAKVANQRADLQGERAAHLQTLRDFDLLRADHEKLQTECRALEVCRDRQEGEIHVLQAEVTRLEAIIRGVAGETRA